MLQQSNDLGLEPRLPLLDDRRKTALKELIIIRSSWVIEAAW
jgi:hypothetical protein